ncbi:helix-turn-helix transcriptional regulator [uncultured Gemmiger sp.]|uniref:helix-turn-helix transcriptional regulator n=1 Tax=uncultured Gemmiger sp. TaxID=1623490 RepID=UPI00261554C3|nr:helix-turn-helix transcriptional regulator [uncultured Gemmiger sp.]
MELNEKLQELRKNKGLTQEELAAALYVSRTAVSKWESGRGLPSIDSLKQISAFFDVSIDDLLSADKALSLAEQENKASQRSFCDLLLGISDLCAILLILLPLYPRVDGKTVYAVDFLTYARTAAFSGWIFAFLFAGLILTGAVKIGSVCGKTETAQPLLTGISLCISIAAVLLLAVTRNAYATSLTFLLLVIKGTLLLKRPQ